MLESVEGFIINEIPYGETSKIINIFTKEHGLIGVLAKGAKSMKSKFRASTGRYSYANFEIYYKEDKLSTLSSVDVIDSLKNIHSDLTLISYTTYISDLINQVVKQSMSNSKKIYDLFISTILNLEKKLDPVVVTNILEIKLLPFLGVGINLDSCALCGNKTNIVTIDGSRGGYVCINCYSNERIVCKETIKLLRMYYYVNIKSISKLNIDESVKMEIDNFLNSYYEDYTGLYIHSKKFLKNIIEI